MYHYMKAIFLVHTLVIANSHHVPGYYWRDFNGNIPDDALPAGKDINNNFIYIGQVYATFLIPAQIYHNDNRAYYEYGGKEQSVTQNIKILCTQNPDEFSWVQTDNDLINKITDKYLVIGGYEPGCTTYIGRARVNGEVIVGKALADNSQVYKGLHATQRGTKYQRTAFEVLVYSPSKSIDVRVGV